MTPKRPKMFDKVRHVGQKTKKKTDYERIATAFQILADAARKPRKGWASRAVKRATREIAKIDANGSAYLDVISAFIENAGPFAPMLREVIHPIPHGTTQIEGTLIFPDKFPNPEMPRG